MDVSGSDFDLFVRDSCGSDVLYASVARSNARKTRPTVRVANAASTPMLRSAIATFDCRCQMACSPDAGPPISPYRRTATA
jgi:hypothetical protein